MGTWMDDEHHLRRRAERVRALLDGLWGDDSPPHRDPRLTLLVDALFGDDDNGRAEQVVVHGDAVTYRQLVEAVAHPGGLQGLTRLPPDFVHRLTRSGALSPAAVSRGTAMLPDEHCGAWQMEFATEVINYDAVTARLLALGNAGDSVALRSTGLATVHPDDHLLVVVRLRGDHGHAPAVPGALPRASGRRRLRVAAESRASRRWDARPGRAAGGLRRRGRLPQRPNGVNSC